MSQQKNEKNNIKKFRYSPSEVLSALSKVFDQKTEIPTNFQNYLINKDPDIQKTFQSFGDISSIYENTFKAELVMNDWLATLCIILLADQHNLINQIETNTNKLISIKNAITVEFNDLGPKIDNLTKSFDTLSTTLNKIDSNLTKGFNDAADERKKYKKEIIDSIP